MACSRTIPATDLFGDKKVKDPFMAKEAAAFIPLSVTGRARMILIDEGLFAALYQGKGIDHRGTALLRGRGPAAHQKGG
jgi:hypothetical protein